MVDNSQQLQARWTIPESPNGVISSYVVNCNNTLSFTFDGVQVSAILTNLQPFTVYECSVYATTAARDGFFSTPSTARTAEAGKIYWTFIDMMHYHYLNGSAFCSKEFCSGSL